MLTLQRYLNDNLRKDKISAWQIKSLRRSSHELYTIRDKTESYRCNETIDYSGVVQKNIEGDESKIGESKFEFQALPGEWPSLIDEAIERTNFVQNPRYEFSAPWNLIPSEDLIFDEEVAEKQGEKILEIEAELRNIASSGLRGCHLVSSEIHLKKNKVSIRNHRGLNIAAPSTKILWDYVLLNPDKTSEVNGFMTRRRLRDLPFKAILEQEAERLIDLEKAQLPPTGNFPVIFGEDALDTLFDFFTSHASANALYFDYSAFEEGKPVLENIAPDATPLTITSDPTLPGGGHSGYFDALGFPLEKVRLIENHVFKNFAIDGKMAYLLNRKRTSALSNVVVEPGREPLEHLREDGVLELLKFSTFSPNGITGAFSGEIRLGYLYKSGEKIPIKGGSVSGMTKEVFQSAIFSKETTQRESYFGPAGVFIKSAVLAGD